VRFGYYKIFVGGGWGMFFYEKGIGWLGVDWGLQCAFVVYGMLGYRGLGTIWLIFLFLKFINKVLYFLVVFLCYG